MDHTRLLELTIPEHARSNSLSKVNDFGVQAESELPVRPPYSYSTYCLGSLIDEVSASYRCPTAASMVPTGEYATSRYSSALVPRCVVIMDTARTKPRETEPERLGKVERDAIGLVICCPAA